MFIQIDNVGAEMVAKTLHPMVGRNADLNFAESAGFLEQLSKAAETDSDAVQRLSSRLKDVEPTVREQFAKLAGVLSERASGQAAGSEARLTQGTRSGAD
jgi:ubiquinone biosynthesis protein UbiJ